ncbi:GNAT family N-acetyltransferase [Gemella cuniculi]|uniref:GNAT family N-acetyltransferase n=1 Tax=Gemella cuniculi TaxID=150240 RepID=UPI00042001DA|nr:GNAT family protein [Gemella cuniculi]
MKLKKITKSNLVDLYNIIYNSQHPEWAKYNAPYFNEYKFLNLDTFLLKNHHEFYLSDKVRGIFLDDKIIGIVTCHWENFATRWLEVGIIIYDDTHWSKGFGEDALRLWIDKCFCNYPEIARLGLTTWSGNIGMMKLSEKLGLILEGRLRKVRYYKGIYYDSLKYGILREEFYNTENKINIQNLN